MIHLSRTVSNLERKRRRGQKRAANKSRAFPLGRPGNYTQVIDLAPALSDFDADTSTFTNLLLKMQQSNAKAAKLAQEHKLLWLEDELVPNISLNMPRSFSASCAA